jgi:hypothetical protein
MVQHPARKNKLITINVVASLSSAVYDAFQRSIVKEARELICATKTSWFVMHGIDNTPDTGHNKIVAQSCNFFALLVLYTEFIIYWVALAVFIELWLRVVFQTDNLPKFRLFYFWCGFGLAIMNALLVNYYKNPSMLQPGNFTTICDYSTGQVWLDFYLRGLPHIIAWAIAVFLGINVLLICGERTASLGFYHENNPLVKLWHANSILFYFLILFIVVYGPTSIWLGFYLYVIVAPQIQDGFIDWTTCIFENFITPEDQNLVDQLCGVVPPVRVPFVQTLGIATLKIFYNVVLFIITLDADAVQFWKTLVISIIACTPIRMKYFIEDINTDDGTPGIFSNVSKSFEMFKMDRYLFRILKLNFVLLT